ncbi:MAG: hypothetical protein D6720_11925 [Gammaproteobacteria bacterium]|nr:MAG: hypothetical protein D6720_11925 [Gammaproteobacteria bacterium]
MAGGTTGSTGWRRGDCPDRRGLSDGDLVRAIIGLLGALLPASAWAHSPIKGLGNLANGILHPLFVPAHLLLVLALGLLLGQQGVSRHLVAVWAYLFGLAMGLLLAWHATVLVDAATQEMTVLCLAVTAALLVVVARPLPSWILLPLGAGAGILLGLDSLQAELEGRARAVALFGSGVGLYLLLLYPMALAERFQARHWQRIGIRVIASWIAASALLVLALLLA